MDGPVARTAGQPPGPVGGFAASADERELIAAVLRKDRKAASQLIAAHIDAIYGYVRHRLAPRVDLVDDVVQEVFLAALNALPGFQGQSSLRTWLIAITRHKIEDVYRQLLRLADTLDDVSGADGDVLVEPAQLDEQIDTARARARTREILARLPERYSLVLLWRYWEQRSTRDIAIAIGATEKSVERTLARARVRFKELWLKE